MSIIYKYSDQEILLPVPVMNISAYSVDEKAGESETEFIKEMENYIKNQKA